MVKVGKDSGQCAISSSAPNDQVSTAAATTSVRPGAPASVPAKSLRKVWAESGAAPASGRRMKIDAAVAVLAVPVCEKETWLGAVELA